MAKLTNRTWRAIDACEVAGVEQKTFSAWRSRYGFLNGDRRGKTARFSSGDVAVLTTMATLNRRGFNARDVIQWVEKLRPDLENALGELFEFGRISKRPRVTLEQEPDAKEGLAPIAPVTFDLGGVCEWVVAKLGIPIPSPTPTAQEAKAFLAYVQTDEFVERLAALRAEIEKRQPPKWDWSDVERATGVPKWFAVWALDTPRRPARKVFESVRDQLPAVRT